MYLQAVYPQPIPHPFLRSSTDFRETYLLFYVCVCVCFCVCFCVSLVKVYNHTLDNMCVMYESFTTRDWGLNNKAGWRWNRTHKSSRSYRIPRACIRVYTLRHTCCVMQGCHKRHLWSLSLGKLPSFPNQIDFSESNISRLMPFRHQLS